jgi:glycosyltransferase involved in cell wall biosynthesis
MTRIFYFAYDHHRPTGGQKTVYRHVDILRKQGIEAFILHLTPGFRLKWFPNSTPVVSADDFSRMFDVQRDVIALPEDLGENILKFPGRKVVINQGAYNGFGAFPRKRPIMDPYLDNSVIAVLVVSEHNREYLQFTYPNLRVIRVFNGIDPEKYSYSDLSQKQRVISCPGLKNQMELKQVFHITNARASQGLNHMEGYRWEFIQDFSEAKTAGVLSESLIFLFLSTMEGFPLMPLEAMMSGCIVCAYDIAPMTEYLSVRNALLASPGDISGMVRKVEQAAEWFVQDGGILESLVGEARTTAAAFPPMLQERSVLEAWSNLLEQQHPC